MSATSQDATKRVDAVLLVVVVGAIHTLNGCLNFRLVQRTERVPHEPALKRWLLIVLC